MSKIVKKNCQISKISKKYFFFNLKFLKNICVAKKNKNFFPNIRNTQFDQSSPVKPNPDKKIFKNEKNL